MTKANLAYLNNNELRVAVIGLGARSALALHAESPINGGRIVAVCDPHRMVAERLTSKLGKKADEVAIFKKLSELIDFGIDVAFVTSPDDTHAEIACQLMKAGVAVYLEKPLAITLQSATEIIQTAHDTKTKLYVGHNMRHMNVVRTMRDIILRGEIGEVKAIWCRHFVGHGGDFYFKDWHATQKHGNGLLLQKGSHDIDVIHWLADSCTTEVVGMGGLTLYNQIADRADNSNQLMSDWFDKSNWPPLSQKNLNKNIDVEDLSMMMMKLESGVFASYEQCHYTPDYWRNYTVIGTEGRIENFGDTEGGLIRLWNNRTNFNLEGDKIYPILGDNTGHDQADEKTVNEFFRFVRHSEPTDTSPLGAWYAVATAILATESIRGGSQPRYLPRLSAQLTTYFQNGQIK